MAAAAPTVSNQATGDSAAERNGCSRCNSAALNGNGETLYESAGLSAPTVVSNRPTGDSAERNGCESAVVNDNGEALDESEVDNIKRRKSVVDNTVCREHKVNKAAGLSSHIVTLQNVNSSENANTQTEETTDCAVVNGSGAVCSKHGPVDFILHREGGEWKRSLCIGTERAWAGRHVWPTRDGWRVNFRSNKFTIPSDVHLADSCDTSYGDVLEFYLTGESSRNSSGLLQKLRSRYNDPHSALYNQNLKFDIVDDRLYVTMPSGIGSDFIAEMVLPQLRHYQSRIKATFPDQPVLILSGSSGLIHFDGVPIRLCGDGSIVAQQELLEKTLQVHALKKAVPSGLKVYVNFEALSLTDDKNALIWKCRNQVDTGQASVSVALCDREGDGEVLVFHRRNTDTLMDRCINPRYIDLGMVIPLFRVYLSYGANIYFQIHHQHKMTELSGKELLCLLCDSILQDDMEMAKEAINGLQRVDHPDDLGRLPTVCAATKGDEEMVVYLLDNGATADGIDGSGVSPVLAARAEGYNNVADILESRGGALDTSGHALVDAIKKSQSKRLELLLQAGVHVDERDAGGKTALMHACLVGEEDAVCKLLRAGASRFLCDNSGRTARVLADNVGNINILNMLDNIVSPSHTA